MPSSKNYSIPSGNTEVRSEVKTSLRQQQLSDVLKQRLQSPRDNSKKTRNQKKGNEKDKHMLDLPEYLQKVDTGESFQEKALNFAVLPRGNADVPSSGSSLARHKTHPSSHSSRPSSMNTSELMLERDTRRDINRFVIPDKETSSFGMRRNEVLTSRKKRNSDEQKSLVLILPKHCPKTNCTATVCTSESILPFDGKSKEANVETVSAEVSSEEVHFGPLPSSKSPTRARNMEPLDVVSCLSGAQHKYLEAFTIKSKSLRGNVIDTLETLDHETTVSGAEKGTVASPSRRFSFSFGKISRSFSSKENSGPIRSEPIHRFSSDEVHSSAELYPFILHACPLPTGKETKEKPSTRRHSLTSVTRTPKKQSSEDVNGPPELVVVQNRHSSPNRRFGFSLGKMKRSYSSKEGSNIPQLSPLRAEVLDHSVFPKENLHSKSRSSPLRRLLDPILKNKATHPCPSAETRSSLEQNPISFSENESFDNTKPRESMVQALLQMTTKNEFPLFKLVVNNSCDILVAMKNITPSGKQDVDSIYTFYAVHEIKKRSGSWINQVHKEKNYGFGYSVVGQMKGFVRFCEESSVDIFEDGFTQKEYVFCSVDRKQGDGEAPEVVPIRELASTVVKIPHGKSNSDGNERNIGKELTGKEFLEYLEEEKYLFGRGETEKFHNTTVILSGADHGLPKTGAPSSLIQRWRSGGSCDCGGWDVGCKLQVLSNEEQSSKLPEPSMSCSIQDHFDLFNQGGAHDSKPIFRLAPFKKGIYSIEFSSSISLVQALSICIAAISSRKSFDFSELNSDGKLLEESNLME